MQMKLSQNKLIHRLNKWVLILMLCLVISGCGNMAKMNSFDRKAAVCTTSIFLGAIVGGVVGGKKGALYGAGGGAVACALFAALDPYDKQRIKETQIDAVSSNYSRNDSWVGKDGKQLVVSVSSPTPVTVTQHPDQICRKISTTLQVGDKMDSGSDIYCRDQNGDWYPMPAVVATN